MPVIPGFNDNLRNALATAGFMKERGLGVINLLPFLRMGASKHEQLGLHHRLAEKPAMAAWHLRGLAEIYARQEIACYLGHQTPF